jgi:hypothetical protein
MFNPVYKFVLILTFILFGIFLLVTFFYPHFSHYSQLAGVTIFFGGWLFFLKGIKHWKTTLEISFLFFSGEIPGFIRKLYCLTHIFIGTIAILMSFMLIVFGG